LLENPDKKGSRDLVEGLKQLSKTPTSTMPTSLANAACHDLGLINSVSLGNMLLNSVLDSGVRPLQTGENAPKSHLILLEINDWVLRHAFAAGFPQPENQ
jgi:hypothetical protein